jgi:hypothetical protein
MNNNNLYIIILLILIIFIILILINNNFKENFICVNPTTYTNKVCKSDLKQINNPINYCNNNDKCNGYISVNIKDKFNNERTVYFKCLDNWSGELYQKDIIYDKLKKINKAYEFSNFKTYKCNNYCPPGKGIIDDSNTCLDCPDNKYNTGDSYQCKIYNNNCPKFGYLKSVDQKTGIINCNPCYPGTYSDIEDANNCKLSKLGYYVNKYGQSIEKPCELGTYSNTFGSINCIPAEKGYYIDLTGQTTAKQCELGTYSNTLGSKSCTSAEKGYYINLTKQTTAKPCELGTYSNSLGNITCSPAEKGYYVDQIGQITAKPCPIDKTTIGYGSKNINDCIIINTQWIYNETGTYIWTCPSGITQISVVAVGGGGGGGNTKNSGASGGGGGGLIWVNNISVIPGNNYTIKVGRGGQGNRDGNSNGQNGGDTKFNNLLIAYGGKGGRRGNQTLGGDGGQRTLNLSNTTSHGGGNGGKGGTNHRDWCGGGGGAGGYMGDGGKGGSGEGNGNNGQGGGGGGGAAFDWSGNAAPGGGVGIYGKGTNGSGGNSKNNFANGKGKSGSGGIEAINTDSGHSDYHYGYGGNSTAGKYGGGGGGISRKDWGYSNGGNGALRIIYNPYALFPTTNVSETDYEKTYINNIVQ